MVALAGPNWRLAPALRQLLDEVDALAPNRSIASDGTIASAAHHVQNPDSDHEIDAEPGGGWVDALDLTDDPPHGADMTRLVGIIVANRDRRLSYAIHDDTIWRSYDRPATRTRRFLAAWTPEPYTGPNPHRSHAHISVNDEHRHDTSPWLTTTPTEDDMPLNADDITKVADASAAATLDQLRKLLTHLPNPSNPKVWNPNLATIRASLAAIAKQVGAAQLDETEIAELVIAGLDPAAIAAAIPDDIAQQVAQELAERLKT